MLLISNNGAGNGVDTLEYLGQTVTSFDGIIYAGHGTVLVDGTVLVVTGWHCAGSNWIGMDLYSP